MNIPFTKYQATGNDFILIDNRIEKWSFSTDEIVRLCDRKFGIGADGLILIEVSRTSDYKVNYYNSDGSQSLCGNGSRAAVQFASTLSMVNGNTTFEAYDGLHDASILPNGIVRLKMNDVTGIVKRGSELFLNTGSPHAIRFVENVQEYAVYEEGSKLRYSDTYKPGGTNVNFVELLSGNTIFVRTYERGVENETLSCGTGVTAAALAASTKGYNSPVKIIAPGGELSVEFTANASADGSLKFSNIFLIGPAKKVFEGTISI